MVTRSEVLAIIQARGGSKGVPKKNLCLLGRHPLVAYSIASGLAAQSVTRLIVSTDDEEIARVSKKYGAEVPFLRPKELATDNALDFLLFEHALRWLDAQEDYRPEVLVQLRPTSPLRPRGLIDEAVRLLLDDPKVDSVRGVVKPSQNPYKMWHMSEKGYLVPLLETEFAEPYNMPQQKLPQTYWQTGHIDAIRYETIINKRSMTGSWVRPVMVEQRYCIDIDTLHDFDLANWSINQEILDIDFPQLSGLNQSKGLWPQPISIVAFDFDGVFTDNRVWVMEDGQEAVACHRGDGMGLELLRAREIETVVLSKESNPVVTARCQKLNMYCQQALEDKAAVLRSLARQRGVDLKNVVYVGNDVNDLDCMRLAGYAVAVADAHPTVLAQADLVLQNCGGHGAVRELCDLILQQLGGERDVESH